MRCKNIWHRLFHVNEGTETSTSTCNKPGSLPYVDYSYTYMRCAWCKKEWLINHTPELKRREKIRDEKLRSESGK